MTPRRLPTSRTGAAVLAAATLALGALVGAPAAGAATPTPNPTVGQLAHPMSHSPSQARHRRPALGHFLMVRGGDANNGHKDFFTLSTHRLAAGISRVRFTNIGSFPHQVQFMRLHKGVTPKAYLASLIKTQGATALVMADAAGGVSALDPHRTQTAWLDLRPGRYVLVCFQSDTPTSPPHFVTGMHSDLLVRGRARHAVRLPRSLGTMYAYTIEQSPQPLMGFLLPPMVRGHGVYRFLDTSFSDTHELEILRLAPGKTAADARNFFVVQHGMGTPPFSGDFGGAGAVMPQGSQWIRLNLAPGNYVAVCFVPDDMPPHLPHAFMGMVTGFTVA